MNPDEPLDEPTGARKTDDEIVVLEEEQADVDPEDPRRPTEHSGLLSTQGVRERRVAPVAKPKIVYLDDERRTLRKTRTNMALTVGSLTIAVGGITTALFGAYNNMRAAQGRLDPDANTTALNEQAALGTELVFYGQIIALAGAFLTFLIAFGNAWFDTNTVQLKAAKRAKDEATVGELDTARTNYQSMSATLTNLVTGEKETATAAKLVIDSDEESDTSEHV